MQPATPPPPPPPRLPEVQQARSGGTSSRGCRVDFEFSVYVGNLDPDTSVHDMEELLYELFLQAGPLSKVYVPFSQDTDKHKGFGFVEFQHVESVTYSLQLMAGVRLCGRILNLCIATPSLPPPTSSSSSSCVTGNPFVCAFESRVAQKEAEVVAENPFLSSLNTHLGGPPFPLPPPPSSVSLPVPPLPPPGLPPPFYLLSLPPPASLSNPPLPLPPLPQKLSFTLPTPPPYPPPPFPSLPPPPPPLMSTPVVPVPSTIPSLFPSTHSSLSLKTVVPSTAESGTSSTPLAPSGTAPPPYGGQILESTGGLSLSLEQTVTEMVSDGLDESAVAPQFTDAPNDDHLGTILADHSGSRAMSSCPMSLEVCLGGGGDGSYSLSPATYGTTGQTAHIVPPADHLHPGESHSDNNLNPFTNSGVVPYPSDYQTGSSMLPYPHDGRRNSGMVPFCDDDRPQNGVVPHPGDVQTGSGLVPYPEGGCLDDNGLSRYNVDFGLLRKHNQSETSMDLTYHVDEPFHDGPSHPPPDVPLDHHTRPEPFGPSPTNLHRSRLGTRDHPAWLSGGTRERLQGYHLQRLQTTIDQLKEAIMTERAHLPLSSSPTPPHHF